MYKYYYKGAEEVELSGVGIIKPFSTFQVDQEINHPLFEREDTRAILRNKRDGKKNKK